MVLVPTQLGDTKESARRLRFEPDTGIGGTDSATNVQKAIEALDTALAPLVAQNAVQRFALKTVNFNSANTDNTLAITLPAGIQRYAVEAVWLSNASVSISTATVGVFTAAGGTGQTIAANQAITVTAAAADNNNNAQSLTLTNAATEAYSDTTLFVRIGTAQGVAATADVVVFIRPLT
jgi:hypothetical protein